MGSDTLETRVGAIVEPILSPHGLVLERTQIRTLGKRRAVVLTVDLADGPGALGSDLLADASREISAALDAHDVVPGAYTLEVSTPGAERELTTPRHWRRAEGRLVRVRRTREAIAAGAAPEVLGRVLSADDTRAVLRTDAGEIELGYGDIAHAGVEVELRRMEES